MRLRHLFLAALLILVLLGGCAGNAAPSSTPAITPAPTAVPTPVPTPVPASTSKPDEPAPWPEPVDTGEVRSFEIDLEGMPETVEMTRYECDLALFGGPVVSLYVDTARYACIAFEGEYELIPKDQAPDFGAHIGWLNGVTADICAQEALNTVAGVATDEGMTVLGIYEAYLVSADQEGCIQRRYYIPQGEDTLALSLYGDGSSEFAEGNAPRLLASLATVEIG